MIESYGNVLLETFAQKNSYSGNFPKICVGKVPQG